MNSTHLSHDLHTQGLGFVYVYIYIYICIYIYITTHYYCTSRMLLIEICLDGGVIFMFRWGCNFYICIDPSVCICKNHTHIYEYVQNHTHIHKYVKNHTHIYKYKKSTPTSINMYKITPTSINMKKPTPTSMNIKKTHTPHL